MCVGNYKEFTPVQIIDIKRKLDKRLYIYAPLFSPDFIKSYNEFIHLCFQTYTGVGHDAKLRTLMDHPMGGDRKKILSSLWQAGWEKLFTSENNCPSLEEISSSYEILMSHFSEELGVGLKADKLEQEKDTMKSKSRD
jgi:hypothetical protein